MSHRLLGFTPSVHRRSPIFTCLPCRWRSQTRLSAMLPAQVDDMTVRPCWRSRGSKFLWKCGTMARAVSREMTNPGHRTVHLAKLFIFVSLAIKARHPTLCSVFVFSLSLSSLLLSFYTFIIHL